MARLDVRELSEPELEALRAQMAELIAHVAELDAIRQDTIAVRTIPSSARLRDQIQGRVARMLTRRFSCLPQVDCHGKAGTLVLWHPRLGHMGACGAFSRNCLRPR